MKLVSFSHNGRRGFGALVADQVFDLSTDRAQTLRTALAAEGLVGLRARAQEQAASIPVSALSWLPPIPDPEKILCVGMNYHGHIRETGGEVPQRPSLFVRFASSIVGHREPILRPSNSTAFDFEGELAVVIGKSGRHIPAAETDAFIAGYSCFAENSVRDFQRHATQATAGKNFERSGAFGPWLVTPDEVGDLTRLDLTTRLNGQVMQKSRLDDLVFSIPDLIAYASSFTRLEAGDVIATGTPSGVGAARKPPLWMKAGDRLEVEISGLGVLQNDVVDETAGA